MNVPNGMTEVTRVEFWKRVMSDRRYVGGRMNPVPHIGPNLRQRMLLREVHMHREHAAEAVAFARRGVPHIVRAELEGIADQRPLWVRRASVKPAPRWLVWTLMVAYSLVMTFAAIQFVRHLPMLWGLLP